MKVKDIMSKDVASVNSNDTIERAAQMMKEHDVGSMPVCNQQNVVGIVTDRDITLRCVAAGQDTKQQKVCDIMTDNPVVGSPDMNVNDAVKIMSEKQIRRLPIVENNSLVGIVGLGEISLDRQLQVNSDVALKIISQP